MLDTVAHPGTLARRQKGLSAAARRTVVPPMARKRELKALKKLLGRMKQWTTYVPTAGADNAGAMEATPASAAPSTTMHVRKRNGGLETADVMKIVRAVERSADGLHGVDPLRVATRTISGLYDGTTTRELDELSIRTAAALIAEEPEYSKLAARPAQRLRGQGGPEPGHPFVLAVRQSWALPWAHSRPRR